ncbi:MAG TPA: DNA polymerase Y family protein [Casimicrobiaceae bacterium]|jgi:protein ImuB
MSDAPPPVWLALRLASLPLDVFARGGDGHDAAMPFAVTSGGHYPAIVDANAAARRAGIVAGTAVSTALALAPGLVLREREPGAEAATLAELATFMLGFTPQACVAAPDAVLAEVHASLRLFGGPARLVRLVDDGLRARGFHASRGIAPTPLAALAFARAGDAAPLFAGDALAARLASLPLAHFDVDAAARTLLAAAGVTTFGEACALPRDALARRCGPALPALIDRALGRVPDTRAPHVPPPRFASRLALPAPVHDAEALGFAVNRLVHALCAWLLARGLGAARIDVALMHERYQHARIGARATRLRFAPGTASRSIAHLNTVLRERLARVALPAPVEAITLACTDTAPVSGHNLDLLPGNERNAIVVPLVDRLRARLGEDSVVALATHAEHRPEAACRERVAAPQPSPAAHGAGSGRAPASAARDARLSPVAGATGSKVPRKPRLRHGTQVMPSPDALAARTQHAAPTMARPLWLLSEPAPLAPAFLDAPWVLRDGPERIESGWWDGGDVRRDYFIAEAPQGGLAWIFRDHRRATDDGEWFLHGWFA